MSDLICPKCRHYGLRWLDPNAEDLLEKGIMQCESANCRAEFKGFPEYNEAIGVPDDDETQPRQYCTNCKKVTGWEDGFNIETGIYTEFLLCGECDGKEV